MCAIVVVVDFVLITCVKGLSFMCDHRALPKYNVTATLQVSYCYMHLVFVEILLCYSIAVGFDFSVD